GVVCGRCVVWTIGLSGGGEGLVVQEVHRRQAVEADLRKVAELERQARWTEASAELERAEARLSAGELGDLRERIDQVRRDLDLVIELDRIRLSRVTSGNVVSRLSRVTSGNLVFYRTKADQDYAKAFADSGVAKLSE